MKILLIFDNRFDTDLIGTFFKKHKSCEVVIFSLISDPAILDAIIAKIHSCGVFSVTIHNSAQTISDQVKELRKEICQWSADIGNWKVSSKAVKDWFLLPGCGVSTWWFSLLSEKNTLKTDAYFRIAQTHAIEQFLSRNNYDLCLLSISNRTLHHAVVSAANKNHIPAKVISARPLLVPHRYKFLILDYLELLGWFGVFLRGIFAWFHIILRCWIAQKRPFRANREEKIIKYTSFC